jgi:membrane protease YdiL (CAAX protease family)
MAQAHSPATERAGTTRRFDWRLFAAGLALLATAAVSALPFMQAIQTMTQGGAKGTDLVFFAAQVLLAGTVALALGLYLGKDVGLGFTLVPHWLRRQYATTQALHVLQLALVVAILGAVGAIIVGALVILTALVFGMDPTTLAGTDSLTALESYPAPWKWFLIALHAGIAEEIFFRLGLLTLLAWLGSRRWHDEHGRLSETVFWTANSVAALAFGAAHLGGGIPYPRIPVIMARIVIQNAALGLVLGWSYRRWGLESAMLAHLFVDIVLYVVLIPGIQSKSPLWMLSALAGLAAALTWAWRGLRTRARTGASVPS